MAYDASLTFVTLLVCFFCALVGADDLQHPLGSRRLPQDAVIQEFKKASIIPEVIDAFEPAFQLVVDFSENTTVNLGNSIDPSLLQYPPNIEIYPFSDDHLPKRPNSAVAILTDPDALSRDKPVWSEMCHWIKYAHVNGTKTETQNVMSYFPPGPPPKTGAHRYVMLVLVPSNATNARLTLSKPADRKHWGYQGVRVGVRQWAQDNGLKIVAGNFFYAQNKEQ